MLKYIYSCNLTHKKGLTMKKGFVILAALMLLALSACTPQATPAQAATETSPAAAAIATQAATPAATETPAVTPSATPAVTTQAPVAAAPFGDADLVFSLNGTGYKLKTDAKPLLDALGPGYKLTASPSCLYVGEDKTFDYPDISIVTFPDGKKDIMDEIDLNTDKYATSRGIKVGNTLDQITAAYGPNYYNDGGVIEYILSGDPNDKKSPMLYFQMDGDTVSLIGLYSASNVQ